MSLWAWEVTVDAARWQLLPRPVGFVLAGGATLGALQVGMLTALAEAGIEPDLVVGTSVGSLNGAVLADVGDVATAADLLDGVWRGLTTSSVFPGGRLAQAWRLARGRSVYPDRGLRRLVRTTLGPRPTFEDLALPLAVVTSNVLTGHPDAYASGDLVAPLLASSAIPGLLPMQDVDGTPHWDGGVTANVPLRTAQRMGAAALVVLDPGDICHRDVAPSGAAAASLAAMGTAIRQRVLVEVTAVAAELPVLYLERPCVTGRRPLSFASTPALLAAGAATARRFLADAPVPGPGAMVGTPHSHEDGGAAAGHEPRFPRATGRARDLWREGPGT